MTVLHFIGFLVVYALAAALSFIAVALVGIVFIQFRENYPLYVLSILGTVVAGLVALSGLMWVLTGDGHLGFFIAIGGITVALILLVEVLSALVGDQNVDHREIAAWYGIEFQAAFPLFEKIKQIVSIVLLLAYPIYIGVGFFGGMKGSPEWSEYVLRATLVVFIGGSYLIYVPAQMYLLVSENIGEGVRTKLFVSSLVGSIGLLVWISVFVWTLAPESTEVPVIGRIANFTPSVMYATLGYVLIVLIVPYLIGHSRHKALISRFRAVRERLGEESAEAAQSQVLARMKNKLGEVRGEIEVTLEEMETDGSYERLLATANATDAEPIAIYLARRTLEQDCRVFHARRLLKIQEQVSDALKALGRDGSKAKRSVKERILNPATSPAPQSTGNVPPAVVAALTALLLALVNPFITAISQRFMSAIGLEVG